MENQRRFTGWHAFGMLSAFFGVVVVVNLYMARDAIGTFGGLVVENSYVASQDFNSWLDEAKRSKALGWQANVVARPDRRLAIELAGAPAGATLTGEARHPLGRLPDIPLDFAVQGDGSFLSAEKVPAGRWTLRLEARSGPDLGGSEQTLR